MGNCLNLRSFKTCFIIAALFLLSVGIRLPFLNRPLGSCPYDWLTAHSLRTVRIFYESGAAKYKFMPIMTFNNPADRDIDSNLGRIKDKEGNWYYTSYGPVGFVLPYLIFITLHLYPDVLTIRCFNLFIQFLSCLIIFQIVSLLTRKYYRNRVNAAALIGLSVYLLSPVALWFHSNSYFSDMCAQIFFIGGIYIFLLMSLSFRKRIYYFPLGLIIILMVWTEWIGIFFSVSVFLLCLRKLRKKWAKEAVLVIVISSLIGLIALLWYYSRISGWKPLFSS